MSHTRCAATKVHAPMNAYLLAAVVGLVVGAIYALLGVRSPAPPVIALVGLLGMLGGEKAVGLARRWSPQKPELARPSAPESIAISPKTLSASKHNSP